MAAALKGKLAGPKTFDSSEPITLRFQLTNQTDHDIYVLKWFTPLEGLNSDCLVVKRNGKTKVRYDGPMVKRGKPNNEDFLFVPAGKTIEAEFDLSESYAVSRPARYQVELNVAELAHQLAKPSSKKLKGAFARARPATQSLSGGKSQFKVVAGDSQKATRGQIARKADRLATIATSAIAKSPQRKPKPKKSGAAKSAATPLPPNIIGGTATQKNQTTAAHGDGFQLCQNASASLANDSQYAEWFGTHSDTRFAKVKAVYSKINDRMTAETFSCDLSGKGCPSGAFAYTYKKSSTIWFCKGFWAAPTTGTDSKAGTVVHEHSHSDANTDDLAYGQDGARQLAKDSADKAVRNADNFEYYAGG